MIFSRKKFFFVITEIFAAAPQFNCYQHLKSKKIIIIIMILRHKLHETFFFKTNFSAKKGKQHRTPNY